MTVPKMVLPATTPQPNGQLRMGMTTGLSWAWAGGPVTPNMTTATAPKRPRFNAFTAMV